MKYDMSYIEVSVRTKRLLEYLIFSVLETYILMPKHSKASNINRPSLKKRVIF
jgi:hypothetical protein